MGGRPQVWTECVLHGRSLTCMLSECHMSLRPPYFPYYRPIMPYQTYPSYSEIMLNSSQALICSKLLALCSVAGGWYWRSGLKMGASNPIETCGHPICRLLFHPLVVRWICMQLVYLCACLELITVSRYAGGYGTSSLYQLNNEHFLSRTVLSISESTQIARIKKMYGAIFHKHMRNLSDPGVKVAHPRSLGNKTIGRR